jgi:histidyl-tRNA synthetase
MKAANFSLQSVKGMKEIFRNHKFYDKVVQGFESQLQDYDKITTNIIEHETTFTKGLGLQSDIVLKEMYKVQSPTGSEKGLVLRPEGTAAVLKTLLNDPKVIATLQKQQTKVTYNGPMFRYERP